MYTLTADADLLTTVQSNPCNTGNRASCSLQHPVFTACAQTTGSESCRGTRRTCFARIFVDVLHTWRRNSILIRSLFLHTFICPIVLSQFAALGSSIN
ncbi:hypothetical protein BKA82DRAFT_1007953 [Pisolithus tinctorius]|uniref:Uncharacterized protein n=1 Tax=Pisolithus tinctorius Marx 270 TaxID=870435 RepID=A0A0C3IQQ6_PISTI|nr:hypothetical protein BKA82DRAFT_1007953 [Pisolithus tinctorius]KIN94938.1 hypothetical protein M404DRAFT_1007953 [Pisolithus tinctorius Marx 270]KIN99272.1 hypothetical protein M404DRAFT_1004756 [Pisolithus tinctorius Marx 270]